MIGNKYFHMLGLSVAGMLLPTLSLATAYYVATNGNDSQSGLTWPNALATISNAVAKADADLVILSNGTYTLAAQVVVDKGITVTGFYGAAQTVVNGARSNRCFFLTHSNAVLSDLTISNGCVTNYTLSNGGGVYIATNAAMRNCTIGWCWATNAGGGVYAATNATLTNCLVINNVCSNSYTTSPQDGGGVYCGGGTLLQNCRIIGNKGMSVGGIYNFQSVISNCVVSNNYQMNIGGANAGGVCINGTAAKLLDSTIVANSYAPPGYTGVRGCGGVLLFSGLISGCTIVNNVGPGEFRDAAGLACWYGASGTISNCLISGNTSPGNAPGGLHVYGTEKVINCTISNNVSASGGAGVELWGGTLIGCTIANNSSVSGPGGIGKMNVGYALGDVSNCVIRANTSRANGGGVFCNYDVRMRNCLFTENVAATNGGGIYIKPAAGYVLTLANCTIASNFAWRGGGVAWGGNAAMVITNCIIYGNAISDVGNTTNIDLYDAAAPTNAGGLAFCCTSETNSFSGLGNIKADPQFRSASGKDFRLGDGSPCRNAGTNQSWMTNSVDLLGNPRIKPQGGIVDMGAYEFWLMGSVFKFR